MTSTTEWNPLATTDPVEVPLAVSGGRATVLLAPWTGRERLAYEDAITERMLTTDTRTGEDTVKMGTLRVFAVSLTLRGSTGFGVDGFLAGDRDKREADLLSITDSRTFDEIVRHALEVQPLPSMSAGDDEGDDGDEGDEEDPSQTPSTPQIPTDVVDA